MNLSVECEQIDRIYARTHNVKLDLYNVDISFIDQIKPSELLKEIDLYKLLDEVDFDVLHDYMMERENAK